MGFPSAPCRCLRAKLTLSEDEESVRNTAPKFNEMEAIAQAIPKHGFFSCFIYFLLWDDQNKVKQTWKLDA